MVCQQKGSKKKTLQHNLGFQTYKADIYDNAFWTYETKVSLWIIAGHNAQWHVWQNPNRAYQQKRCTPTFKHGGRRVMI